MDQKKNLLLVHGEGRTEDTRSCRYEPQTRRYDITNQIVPGKGLPFGPKLLRKPTAIDGMSREQLDAELQKGVDSMKGGKAYTEEEVDAMLAEEWGMSRLQATSGNPSAKRAN